MFIFKKFKEMNLLEQIKISKNIKCLYNIPAFIILIVALYAIYDQQKRPISVAQYQSIVELADKADNPQTQQQAVALLAQDSITRIEYFRLIFAHQYENKKAKKYLPDVSN